MSPLAFIAVIQAFGMLVIADSLWPMRHLLPGSLSESSSPATSTRAVRSRSKQSSKAPALQLIRKIIIAILAAVLVSTLTEGTLAGSADAAQPPPGSESSDPPSDGSDETSGEAAPGRGRGAIWSSRSNDEAIRDAIVMAQVLGGEVFVNFDYAEEGWRGVHVMFTDDMRSHRIKGRILTPPGFQEGKMERSHLWPRRFLGPDDVIQNIFAAYIAANQSHMRRFENRVNSALTDERELASIEDSAEQQKQHPKRIFSYKALRSEETKAEVPARIRLKAIGDRGFHNEVIVTNEEHPRELENNPDRLPRATAQTIINRERGELERRTLQYMGIHPNQSPAEKLDILQKHLTRMTERLTQARDELAREARLQRYTAIAWDRLNKEERRLNAWLRWVLVQFLDLERITGEGDALEEFREAVLQFGVSLHRSGLDDSGDDFDSADPQDAESKSGTPDISDDTTRRDGSESSSPSTDPDSPSANARPIEADEPGDAPRQPGPLVYCDPERLFRGHSCQIPPESARSGQRQGQADEGPLLEDLPAAVPPSTTPASPFSAPRVPGPAVVPSDPGITEPGQGRPDEMLTPEPVWCDPALPDPCFAPIPNRAGQTDSPGGPQRTPELPVEVPPRPAHTVPPTDLAASSPVPSGPDSTDPEQGNPPGRQLAWCDPTFPSPCILPAPQPEPTDDRPTVPEQNPAMPLNLPAPAPLTHPGQPIDPDTFDTDQGHPGRLPICIPADSSGRPCVQPEPNVTEPPDYGADPRLPSWWPSRPATAQSGEPISTTGNPGSDRLTGAGSWRSTPSPPSAAPRRAPVNIEELPAGTTRPSAARPRPPTAAPATVPQSRWAGSPVAVLDRTGSSAGRAGRAEMIHRGLADSLNGGSGANGAPGQARGGGTPDGVPPTGRTGGSTGSGGAGRGGTPPGRPIPGGAGDPLPNSRPWTYGDDAIPPGPDGRVRTIGQQDFPTVRDPGVNPRGVTPTDQPSVRNGASASSATPRAASGSSPSFTSRLGRFGQAIGHPGIPLMEPFEANAHDEELWDGTPAETPELEQLAEADRQISEAFRYQPRVTLFNLITSYTDEDHNDPDYHPIGTPFRDALNIVRYELGIDDDRDELPRVYTTELARIDELKQADEAAADERIAALGSSGDAGRQEDDRSDATTEPPPDPAAARAKQEAQARERFEAMGEAQAEDRAEDRADPEVNGTAADESTAQRRPQPPGGDGPPAAAPSESSNDDHENPGIAPERAPVPRTGPRLDAGNQDTSSGDPPSAGEGESRTVVPTGQQYPAATIEESQDGDTGEAPAEDQQPPPGQPHPQTGGGGGASSGLAEGANDPTTPETEDPAERDQQGQDDSRTATSTGQQYPAAIVEERNNTETDRAAPPPKEAELNQNRIGASHAKENRNAERAPTPTNNNQGPPATPAQPSQADKEALQEAARESGGSGRPTL